MRYIIPFLFVIGCSTTMSPKEHALSGPRLEEPARSHLMFACMAMAQAPVTHCLCIEGHMAKGVEAPVAHELCLKSVKDEILKELEKNSNPIPGEM